ncbi:unnamed protein product [Caenorhabditis angaria]|uniref:Tyrosine-protein kinase n=1 Tax=Caenorhabditis angaria TaxID=860376 RepID=A0A9P1MW80_9PELO|nr:unnamed protein product [Caenorhabditis angaria]
MVKKEIEVKTKELTVATTVEDEESKRNTGAKKKLNLGKRPSIGGGTKQEKTLVKDQSQRSKLIGISDRLEDIRERSQASSIGLDPGKTLRDDFKIIDELVSSLNCFHGYICREDVQSLLKKFGDYLIRITCHVSPTSIRTKKSNVRGTDKKKRTPSSSRATDKSMKQDILLSTQDFVIAVYGKLKDPKSKKKSVILNVMIRRTIDGLIYIDPQKPFKDIKDLLDFYSKNTGINKGYEFQLLKPIELSNWEYKQKDIGISDKKLGEGAFGEVRVGKIKLKNSEKTMNVAVKMLKNSDCISREQVVELLHEGRVMRYLDHKNVLRSYGMAVIRQPLYLMSEICEYGALREYLRENSKTTTDAERIQFCLGSAKGVEYLHSQRLIHRDLATRNVLLTEEKIPKISDFGLAKVTDRYEMKEQCKTPVRYLAPETLENYIFTSKSDVFSFGMVIWEIYENGQQPHDGKNAQTIRDLTKKQQFLKLNEKAPNELRKLVSDKIFVPDPENRCNMSTVVQTIEKLMPTFNPFTTTNEKMNKNEQQLWISATSSRTYSDDSLSSRRHTSNGFIASFFDSKTSQYVKLIVLCILAVVHLVYMNDYIEKFAAFDEMNTLVEISEVNNGQNAADIQTIRYTMNAFIDYKKNLWMTVGSMCASLATTASILMISTNGNHTLVNKPTMILIRIFDLISFAFIGCLLFARVSSAVIIHQTTQHALKSADRLVSLNDLINQLSCSISPRDQLPLCSHLFIASIFPVKLIEYLIILCLLTGAYIGLAYLIQWCIRHFFPPTSRQQIHDDSSDSQLVDQKLLLA